jgi:predicted RNase H-like HicB family nuclease
MKHNQNHFDFTGAIFREGRHFVSLCLELDVASQGRSPKEARKMLAEAVILYLETCFEHGVPHQRPVPREEDPRVTRPPNLLELFLLKINFDVHALPEVPVLKPRKVVAALKRPWVLRGAPERKSPATQARQSARNSSNALGRCESPGPRSILRQARLSVDGLRKAL